MGSLPEMMENDFSSAGRANQERGLSHSCAIPASTSYNVLLQGRTAAGQVAGVRKRYEGDGFGLYLLSRLRLPRMQSLAQPNMVKVDVAVMLRAAPTGHSIVIILPQSGVEWGTQMLDTPNYDPLDRQNSCLRIRSPAISRTLSTSVLASHQPTNMRR